jgi:multisubunit Na+/H+ antiporter MnhE subunit
MQILSLILGLLCSYLVGGVLGKGLAQNNYDLLFWVAIIIAIVWFIQVVCLGIQLCTG